MRKLDGRVRADVFLCKVHSYRTLQKRVYIEGARRYLYQAMSAFSKIGCESYIDLAIGAAKQSQQQVNYIKKNWNLKTSEMWGTWCRSHSAVLLQNLTTNVAESYHSQLKRDSKINVSSGLKGVVFRVKEIAAVYKRRQETATQEFRTKTVSTVKEYEEIKHFPFPVQKKIHSIEANEEKRDAFNSHYCEFTERMKGMILADSVDEIRAKRSRRNRK